MVDDAILANLSDVQRKAVVHPGGPLLIFAGAGSGKTRVLTHRVAYLIHELNVNPSRIFAVTFTNKAAAEMKERVEELIPGSGRLVWVSTFHSACVRILRRDGERLGYSPTFAIYDDGDQMSLIKQVIKQLDIDKEDLEPRFVRNLIDRAKCDAADPATMKFKLPNIMAEKYVKVCEKYENELKKNNAFDFGDLIVKAGVVAVLATATDPAGHVGTARLALTRKTVPGVGKGYRYSRATRAACGRLLARRGWRTAVPPMNSQGMLEMIHERTGLTFVLIPEG